MDQTGAALLVNVRDQGRFQAVNDGFDQTIILLFHFCLNSIFCCLTGQFDVIVCASTGRTPF